MISNPIKKVAFNINEKHSNNNALRRLIHCLFAENLIDKKQVYWDIDHCGYIYKFKKTPYKILLRTWKYTVDTFFNYGGIYLINNNNKKKLFKQYIIF
ncbi:hypothetical protein AB6G21_06700 [Providencia hangzhouensis]|uniref:hypothetical protein n=1 Tax=Providencia hangzhouensis TaxID=3031799 RepID=UPI0034DD32FB